MQHKSEKHENPEPAPEPAPGDVGAELAKLADQFVIVVRSGHPIPVTPPEFGDPAIRSAWLRDFASDVGADLSKDGVAFEYSDADKIAYGIARGNGGGIVAGKTVTAFQWKADPSHLPHLQEAADRVRWDALCYGGKWAGEYAAHRTQAEVTDRAEICAVMLGERRDMVPGPIDGRAGFGGGKTYGELILAKAAEMLGTTHKPKTRTKKAKSSEAGV